jgi:hypothetical protein
MAQRFLPTLFGSHHHVLNRLFSFCYLEKRLVASFTQNWDQPPFWRLIKSIFSEKKEEKKIEISYFIYYKNEMRAGSFGPSYFQMMISFFFLGGR